MSFGRPVTTGELQPRSCCGRYEVGAVKVALEGILDLELDHGLHLDGRNPVDRAASIPRTHPPDPASPRFSPADSPNKSNPRDFSTGLPRRLSQGTSREPRAS
jgi:hypothetical protein